jgi:SAM-dependent methyltransferase
VQPVPLAVCEAARVTDPRPAGLLTGEALLGSAVVANCAMNRERQLTGVNSYARELGFNPIDLLLARLTEPGDVDAEPAAAVGWLDLCCGRGRALLQAGARATALGLDDRVTLVGVDLVDAFDPRPPGSMVQLLCAAVEQWAPPRSFDLITCVHGLHYVGDKLAVLTRAARWLSAGGRLVADLDLTSIRVDHGPSGHRRLSARLREAGFAYDRLRRRITCTGPIHVDLPYTFLGADDRAGANYTGQPAVNSHYTEHR